MNNFLSIKLESNKILLSYMVFYIFIMIFIIISIYVYNEELIKKKE